MIGTAIAIAGSMIGTALLIMPQIFLNYGLVACITLLVNVVTNIVAIDVLYGLHVYAVGSSSSKGRSRLSRFGQ